jgi:hypothetical protein
MSNFDLGEPLWSRINFYYKIFKESDLATSVINRNQKERERERRYYDEVDRFLALKALPVSKD